MADQSVAELKQKLAQAREVIAHLIEKSSFDGAEAHRALSYFANDGFESDFLPWPRHEDDGLRPDQLSAANDD